MRPEKKLRLEQRRRWRIRKKVRGTADRPRLSVRFTERHIYVQFINDNDGVTVAATSTRSKTLPERGQIKANVDGAKRVGVAAAEAAQAKGIRQVVFDRNGAMYHGKVKALAEAVREGGVQF